MYVEYAVQGLAHSKCLISADSLSVPFTWRKTITSAKGRTGIELTPYVLGRAWAPDFRLPWCRSAAGPDPIPPTHSCTMPRHLLEPWSPLIFLGFPNGCFQTGLLPASCPQAWQWWSLHLSSDSFNEKRGADSHALGSSWAFSATSHYKNQFCAAKLAEIDFLEPFTSLWYFISESQYCGYCHLNRTVSCPHIVGWESGKFFPTSHLFVHQKPASLLLWCKKD